MAIDFPNSPTLNQDYTVGTTTWTYDGSKWVLKTYNSLHAVPVTAMMLWANTTYPTGWLLADGSAISRTTYADLFTAIGTTYGVGDGSTTFNLPNMPSAGTGSPNTIIKVTNSGALEPSAISHAANHTEGGSDVVTVTGNQISNYQTYRNVIINGSMNVWQRNTSSTTLGYATVDRWWVNNGGGTTTIAREATIVPARFQYAMKWTQATTANVVGIQAIESVNCAHLAGQTVTVSGYFAASASTSFTIDLLSSTSVDVAPASFSTSISPTSGGSGTVSSTTYVRVTGVYAVPSNVKSLAVRINATSLTNGTSFYFTGIQLEAGSVATPFEFEPFETTLRKCQRYYMRWNVLVGAGRLAMGSATSATAAYFGLVYRVAPRTHLGTLDTGGALACSDGATGTAVTTLARQDVTCSDAHYFVGATTAGGLTIYRPYWLESTASSTTSYVASNMEL
jgi:microcystin-dependent protein